MKDSTLEGCLEIISSLFEYKGSGMTICWSLHQWTDGYWSIRVVDNWHKWLDNDIPELHYKYSTPLAACQEWLKYVSENDIVPHELQEEQE